MRPPRLSFAGATYHVTTRCNNQRFDFKEDSDFELFLQILGIAKKKYEVLLYGYCLTHNHFHLVAETPHKDNISAFMCYLNGQFARAYNRKHGRTGHFWGDRYNSVIIEAETQLFNTLLYDDLNMVRCEVVDDPKNWKWSSYNTYAYGEENPLIDLHPLYLELAETPEKRQEIYRSMAHHSILEKGLLQNRLMSKGIVIGSESFIKLIAEQYGKHPFYQGRKIYVANGVFSLCRFGQPVDS